MGHILEIKNLEAGIEGKKILRGINLTIKTGKIHALMGPNGSGKSTLANVIMGNPKYEMIGGEILFDGKNVIGLKPNERAKLGLFLSFQHPLEIPGLKFSTFLREAQKSICPGENMNLIEFNKKVKGFAEELGMEDGIISRDLNRGFSGGEKKRSEIIQMLTLRPKIAVLDETDSGLDIDSLKTVAGAIETMRGKNFGALVITHYIRILEHLTPDFIHVMVNGKIVSSGKKGLANEIEKKGYSKYLKEAGIKQEKG